MFTRKKAVFFILTLALSFFTYYRGITPILAESEVGNNNLYQQLELFNTVISKIQKDYVDEVTARDLIYGALKGMLSSLDSHSQFMDPESYKEMKVDTEGQFGGLGIEITMQDHVLTVVSPIEDTPACKVGIQPNDKIIKINGKTTKNLSLMEAVKKLRGKPGSKVHINVLRPDTSEFLEFTIVRDIIKIQSVKDVKMLADKIGYIRLTQFQEKTADELESALKDLEGQGMEGLVLDLRNNPGGLLNEAVDVADKFVGGGKLIVSTKGRIVSQNKEYRASSTATHPDLLLAVLINGGSASGSEIVAGAIQDWRRGVLIGTTTFGKGSVQSVLPMKDGSALRLTTAKYYTPNGRSIHEIGIKPDIVIPYQKAEKKEAKKTDENSVFDEMDNNGSEEETEEPENNGNTACKEKYEEITDNQLLRAVDLIKGILILNQQGKLASEEEEPVSERASIAEKDNK